MTDLVVHSTTPAYRTYRVHQDGLDVHFKCGCGARFVVRLTLNVPKLLAEVTDHVCHRAGERRTIECGCTEVWSLVRGEWRPLKFCADHARERGFIGEG